MNIICYELIQPGYVLYPYYHTFLSCTNMYEWISVLVFFLPCTTLYKWLSILFLDFVMHISVRMTIHKCFFHHAYLCTNYYLYYFWFSSFTYLYEWLSFFLVFVMHIFVWMTIHIILGFRHVQLCTNEYPFYFLFSSCTSLYEWQSILF